MDDEAKGASKLSLPNIQFSVTTAQQNLAVVPMKTVRMRNEILGQDWNVKPPDMKIIGNSNYELNYLKNLS